MYVPSWLVGKNILILYSSNEMSTVHHIIVLIIHSKYLLVFFRHNSSELGR